MKIEIDVGKILLTRLQTNLEWSDKCEDITELNCLYGNALEDLVIMSMCKLLDDSQFDELGSYVCGYFSKRLEVLKLS